MKVLASILSAMLLTLTASGQTNKFLTFWTPGSSRNDYSSGNIGGAFSNAQSIIVYDTRFYNNSTTNAQSHAWQMNSSTGSPFISGSDVWGGSVGWITNKLAFPIILTPQPYYLETSVYINGDSWSDFNGVQTNNLAFLGAAIGNGVNAAASSSYVGVDFTYAPTENQLFFTFNVPTNSVDTNTAENFSVPYGLPLVEGTSMTNFAVGGTAPSVTAFSINGQTYNGSESHYLLMTNTTSYIELKYSMPLWTTNKGEVVGYINLPNYPATAGTYDCVVAGMSSGDNVTLQAYSGSTNVMGMETSGQAGTIKTLTFTNPANSDIYFNIGWDTTLGLAYVRYLSPDRTYVAYSATNLLGTNAAESMTSLTLGQGETGTAPGLVTKWADIRVLTNDPTVPYGLVQPGWPKGVVLLYGGH